ncbi:hypothetical protein [Devosia sp.]|uniref:hypothetical protein n=1 Tax=Devosia sp. TaxID=1871048 RepID=UPI003A9592FB
MHKLFKIAALHFALLSWLVPDGAMAQSVRDTAFCRNVVDHECVGVIPDGATVSISYLSTIEGRKAIHFWGNLRNPSASAVAFFFTREGKCYDNEPVSPSSKALRELSGAEQIFGVLGSLTFREIWQALGISSAEVGAKDIKVNVVFIPQTNEYRIHDYRFALCPGKFSARLINSAGNPIPGNNEIDIVLVD